MDRKGTMHFGGLALLASVLAMIFTSIPLDARAQTAHGLVTIGMQRVFEDVLPAFEAATGQTIEVEFASIPDIAKRVESGERADFVIASRAGLDAITPAGKLAPGQSFILGGSLITVAVPPAAPSRTSRRRID